MAYEVDSGYEPWARANVKRGQPVEAAAAQELLEKLDSARARIVELETKLAELMFPAPMPGLGNY